MTDQQQPASLRITVYKTRTGEWRWRVRAPNNVIIGASSEAYTQRRHALENCEVVTGFKLRPPTGAPRLVYSYVIKNPLWRWRRAT